uniref:Aminopeptidase N-like N-terminal domain-containing protein n=1 Tax=Felis catus TaxID=9685 RepID=A0ABI7XVE5_FELCA|nr:puromycin-sensitive aminopeptidase-like protein [Panthera onca]
MWLAAAAPSLARRLLFLGPPPPPLLLLLLSRSSRRRLHSLGRAAMPEKRPFERLPADVSPINYSLCLKPDLLDFTFEGKLEAAAQVRQATNQIVMNCADIDIITASYAPEGDEGLVKSLALKPQYKECTSLHRAGISIVISFCKRNTKLLSA